MSEPSKDALRKREGPLFTELSEEQFQAERLKVNAMLETMKASNEKASLMVDADF
jgi:hypothetical protein